MNELNYLLFLSLGGGEIIDFSSNGKRIPMLNCFQNGETYLSRGESMEAHVLLEEAESPVRDPKNFENKELGDINKVSYT